MNEPLPGDVFYNKDSILLGPFLSTHVNRIVPFKIIRAVRSLKHGFLCMMTGAALTCKPIVPKTHTIPTALVGVSLSRNFIASKSEFFVHVSKVLFLLGCMSLEPSASLV